MAPAGIKFSIIGSMSAVRYQRYLVRARGHLCDGQGCAGSMDQDEEWQAQLASETRRKVGKPNAPVILTATNVWAPEPREARWHPDPC